MIFARAVGEGVGPRGSRLLEVDDDADDECAGLGPFLQWAAAYREFGDLTFLAEMRGAAGWSTWASTWPR
jgi:hypothetical protein